MYLTAYHFKKLQHYFFINDVSDILDYTWDISNLYFLGCKGILKEMSY